MENVKVKSQKYRSKIRICIIILTNIVELKHNFAILYENPLSEYNVCHKFPYF